MSVEASPPRFDPAFRAALHTLLMWRRDVRAFHATPLPEGTFERLVRIACLAPSVGLSEPWRFVSVSHGSRRANIRASFARCNAEALARQNGDRAAAYARLKLSGLDDAPCQFAVYADHSTGKGHALGRRTMPQTLDYSTVIAIHTLWLAARAEGLGLGWVSILDPAEVAQALDVPPAWTFIGYFCLGYPAADDSVPALQRADWERRADPETFILRR